MIPMEPTLTAPAPVATVPVRIDVAAIQAQAAADLAPTRRFYLVDEIRRLVMGKAQSYYFSTDWRNVFFYPSVVNGFEGFTDEMDAIEAQPPGFKVVSI